MSDLRSSLPVKVAAAFLTVVLSLAAILSSIAFVVAYNEGYYEEAPSPLTYADTEAAKGTAEALCHNALWDVDYDVSDYGQISLTITNSEGEVVLQQGDPSWRDAVFSMDLHLSGNITEARNLPEGEYQAVLTVGGFQEGKGRNPFYEIALLFDTVYPIRTLLMPTAIITILLSMVGIVFLCCAAGHKKGAEGIVPNVQDRIPLDLYLCGDAVLVSFLFMIWDSLSYSLDPLLRLFFYCLSFLPAGFMVLALLMTLSTRLKLGRFWENTVCWRILRFARRLVRALFRGLVEFFHLLPMTWRAAGLTAAVLVLQSFLFYWANWDMFMMVLMLAMDFFLLVWAVYLSWSLQRLKKAGQALAEGQLDAKVDTRMMLWDFKRHGENLNAIGEGMNRAVDQRMRSERLKTELITNVSHDIKTPLTSIVNYVDLLKKEELPQTAAEYVAVLDRQSRRLKKLTEDLVEASKASTGNMKVELQPIVVNEIIHQAIGDYDQRLTAGKLETIVSTYQGNVSAMADGRLLWRVLDNLLSNVCKYAMAGSRVYIDLSEKEGHVLLSMKNVSRDPLNISADELMERFVRGDASRHTEGSGLGLNIAKSLMELMGGTFAISVDGDLFKAELTLKGVRDAERSGKLIGDSLQL